MKKIPILLAVASLLLLQSCASHRMSEVKRDERATSGQYDGVWTATMAKGQALQYLADNWQVTCGDMSAALQFRVKDGIAYVGEGEVDNTTIGYVGEKGDFRFVAPTQASVSTSAASDSTLHDGAITLILTGSLQDKNRKGFFIRGIKEFNNNGCTTKVKYQLAA